MSLSARLAIPALCALVCCCGGGTTAPSGSTKQPSPPALRVACETQPRLACSASFYGDGDVTALASWSAADSFRLAMDVPVTSSGGVTFPLPGVPATSSAKNIYIRADYASPRWPGYRARSIAPHAYTLTPDGAAVPLAYLSGGVWAGTPGSAPSVGGATVTIVSGEGAGRRTATIDNGSFFFEFMHLGQPFTVRASKDGYTTDTRDHPGIVDDAFGYPSSAAVTLVIVPER